MSDHKYILELIPAYALNCLADDEVELVAIHLAGCPACQAELAAYQQLTAQLALAAPDAAPPAGLRRRLLETVRPAGPGGAVSSPSGWASFIYALRRPLPAWSLVGMVALWLLAGLWLVYAGPFSPAPAGTMQTVVLLPTEAAPEAQGLLVIGSDGNEGAVVVEDLPALTFDQQYQLWLINPQGERTSGAVFSVDEHGYAAALVTSPLPLTHYAAFGITIEPAGGSPGPTGPKILGGAF